MRRNPARHGPCLLLTSVLALLWFAGCAATGGAPKLEEHLRTMTTIQDSSGAVVFCPGESADIHEGAEILSLTCEAADGSLHIAGESQTCTGVYRLTQSSPRDALYEITVGGEVYTAVTGMTTYADGSESPTFLINTPDYTLTFHAAQP